VFDAINIEAAGSGTGSGSLSAAPAPLTIDCRITAGVTSGSCDDEFNDAGGGGVFSVTATPDNGSEFSLWDRLECSPEVVGACDLDCGANGADPNCTLSVDDQSGDVSFRVTARFSAVSDPEPTVIQGFVLDTAASPNPVSGVWASAALNEMVVSVDTSDALGFFLHDVATGGDYAAVAVGKLGLLAFSVRDSVQVATGDTPVASLNARAGASLAFTNGVGDLTAAAGATVTLPALDWQVWSRTGGGARAARTGS
jgi:hypothetical protein